MGSLKNLILCILMTTLACSCTRSQKAAAPKKIKSAQDKAVPGKCPTTGIPSIDAIYTGEGVLVWESGQPFPQKNMFFDSVEIKGKNLCSGKLTMADGFSPAVGLPYTVLPNGNLKIPIPWELERITQSLLFRTDRSFTRIDFHFIPMDKLKRQIFVRGMKNSVFR